MWHLHSLSTDRFFVTSFIFLGHEYYIIFLPDDWDRKKCLMDNLGPTFLTDSQLLGCHTPPFGWLGNRQSDWLLFDWFRGAWNRIGLIGPVDPDPLTNRSLPVPFKHQLRNWWSNFILLKGRDGWCVFRPRWALCAASSALLLRDNNFACYQITVALHSIVILSSVIDILGCMHCSMSPLV